MNYPLVYTHEPRNENGSCMQNLNSHELQELPRTLPDLPLLALQASLTGSNELLIFRGRLGRCKVRILIDSGARGNFVSQEMKEKLQLKTDDANPVKIVLADGRTHLGF